MMKYPAITGAHCRRSAFTLLEVLLASAIAVLLLGALYVAMTVELHQASAGRDIVEQATLARAIVNRMTLDLSLAIGPVGPQNNQSASGTSGGITSGSSTTGSSSSSSSGASSSTGSSTNTGTGASSTGSSTTGSSNSNSSSSNSSGSNSSTSGSTSSSSTGYSTAAGEAAQTASTPIPLATGVVGTNQVLIIYTTRLPSPSLMVANQNDPTVWVPCDIRRITYWLGQNGGLCRQETSFFNANDDILYLNNTSYGTSEPPTDPYQIGQEQNNNLSEDAYIIAKEVTDLMFEYYDVNSLSGGDGTGWNSLWNGTDPGPNGVTPTGPPTAIRVTLTIKSKDAHDKDITKTYQHVIPILTANGPDINIGTNTTLSAAAGN